GARTAGAERSGEREKDGKAGAIHGRSHPPILPEAQPLAAIRGIGPEILRARCSEMTRALVRRGRALGSQQTREPWMTDFQLGDKILAQLQAGILVRAAKAPSRRSG